MGTEIFAQIPVLEARIENITVMPEVPTVLQEKTATSNGEVTADEGYDGLSKVTVNVAGEAVEEYDGSYTLS